MFSILGQNQSETKFYSQLQKLADKWAAIAFNPQPDSRKTVQALEAVYSFLGLNLPEIYFVKSPQAALQYLQKKQPEINLNININSSTFQNWKRILNKQLAAPKMAALSEDEHELVIDLVISGIGNPPWQLQPDPMTTSARAEDLSTVIDDQLRYPLVDHFFTNLPEEYRQQMREVQWAKIARYIVPPIDFSFTDNRLPAIEKALKTALVEELSEETWQKLLKRILLIPTQQLNFIRPDLLAWDTHISLSTFDMDFYRFLGFKVDEKHWKIWENLLTYCGWVLPFRDFCIVSQRPTYAWDNQGNFHADGEPAIAFADGTGFYYFHGVRLPEKYQIPSEQWQANWLLTEPNAEVRRALIQGLGYGRICQELAANVIDIWQGYELLKIQAYIDFEDILLLKMTCPSTGHIHALRVPPQLKSAREAIRWVNWDIDPQEFAVQT